MHIFNIVLVAVMLLANPTLARGQSSDCLTSEDIEGPYYVEGTPFRNQIASPTEPGKRLHLSGTVYANDCMTPLIDAVLDVWQANSSGCYSINDRKPCPAPPSRDYYNLRGRIRTGPGGKYTLETIKPAEYSDHGLIRPSHIHFKVFVREKEILTTQLYFKGEKHNETDPWASLPKAMKRTISLEERQGELYGVFDIVVGVAPEKPE